MHRLLIAFRICYEYVAARLEHFTIIRSDIRTTRTSR